MKWMGQKCIPAKKTNGFYTIFQCCNPQRPGRVLTHATPSDIKRLQNVCQFVMTQPQLQSKHLEVPQAAQSCPKPGSLYPIDPHGPTLLHSRQRRRPLRDGLRLKCCLQIDVANCPTVWCRCTIRRNIFWDLSPSMRHLWLCNPFTLILIIPRKLWFSRGIYTS